MKKIILILAISAGGYIGKKMYDAYPSEELTEENFVTIEGKEFPKTKDGRYNVDGTPTLFIDNSKTHKRLLSKSEVAKEIVTEGVASIKAGTNDAMESIKDIVEKRNEVKKAVKQHEKQEADRLKAIDQMEE